MKKIITIIILVLIFNLNVSALTLKPTGDITGIRNNKISIYLTLEKTETEKSVSALDGEFNYDKNIFELIDYSLLINDWTEFSGINKNKFAFANLKFNNLLNENQNILKINFKVKEKANYGNTKISITNPNATDEFGEGLLISGDIHNIKILSDENNLSNIKVEGTTINFDEKTIVYNLKVNNSSTNIVSQSKDSNAIIKGDIGIKKLDYGLNIFKINVTSESGKNKTYTLNITRDDTRSKINTISKLKLSDGTINFKEDLNNYNLTVENNISEIKIDANLKDSKSTFIKNYGPRIVKLNVGKNLIQIKVKAENEQVNTYNINIIRKEKRNATNNTTEKLSNNNFLSEIIINNEQFKFNKEEYEHFLTVDYKTEKIDILAETEDEKATYEVIGNNDIIVGENEFFIKVKAEDNTIREYKILIKRKEENIKLSNNSKLKELTINGYKIDFNKETYDYNIKIKNEKELSILYSAEDSKSNVIISGNKNLKYNSIIRITVVAEDQSVTEYRVNIKKEKSENKLILIALTILSFGLLVFIASQILKDKFKKNNS